MRDIDGGSSWPRLIDKQDANDVENRRATIVGSPRTMKLIPFQIDIVLNKLFSQLEVELGSKSRMEQENKARKERLNQLKIREDYKALLRAI